MKRHRYAFAPVLKQTGPSRMQKGHAYAEVFIRLPDGTKKHTTWYNYIPEGLQVLMVRK